jgi:RNA polymerase sigma factor (sigma-70 family)
MFAYPRPERLIIIRRAFRTFVIEVPIGQVAAYAALRPGHVRVSVSALSVRPSPRLSIRARHRRGPDSSVTPCVYKRLNVFRRFVNRYKWWALLPMPISSLRSSRPIGMAIGAFSDWLSRCSAMSIGGAVQEAFARALRSRSDLHDLDSLHGWLWRTLVNVCRAEKRRLVAHLEGTPEPEPNGQADEWFEVRAVIAALPERQRLVLFLRHYADLDYQNIAEVVGIERGTVAATLHTAHQKVREAIKEVQR